MEFYGLAILLWVFFVHLAGIYLFNNGFLLTRLALTNLTYCTDGSCTVRPTHQRAVVLIIDALRFDFISGEFLEPLSPHHHNVLTLPQELTASRPKHSLIFNSYADPPTTTLQRIKGITTGSLPTFVDLGSNFGGSSIDEDSIIQQLKLAGKKLAFMGDDTWMSVFPDSFAPNMSFPYDSFNVEDLHTVDEGVIRHLFPLLEDENKPFDFLVGHFLGVDHVGHRVGPDHPGMKAKLKQMNDVLKHVVDKLEDDTLLVVLGDHGMDRSGDHGGDGILETSSAMWIYSKGPALTAPSDDIPSGLLRYHTFPGASSSHRAIQQIDIVPSLSLLLGLPIPYNNLGSVIPELFWKDAEGLDLLHAFNLNSLQIKTYLETYRNSDAGRELDESWSSLQSAWDATQAVHFDVETSLITLSNYNRIALSACRSMWAQFNPMLIAFGLSLLVASLLATWRLYSGLSQAQLEWQGWSQRVLARIMRGVAGGSIFGMLGFLSNEHLLQGNIDALDCILFAAPMVSCLMIIVDFSSYSLSITSFPVLLLLHGVAFFSNSFTFWEDRIVVYLLISSIVPFVLTGFSAPTTRLRYRILGFSTVFAICVRLIGISTVCREEQQPYCHVTFYATSSIPIPPVTILMLAIPMALFLPKTLKRILTISQSHFGAAQAFFPLLLTPALIGGTMFWLCEWVDSAEMMGSEWGIILRILRTWIARLSMAWIGIVGGSLWWAMPVCLKLEVKEMKSNQKRQVNVLGFGNVFGSGYLLFWCISFTIVFITSQLTGQVVLALSAIALVSFLEVVDSARDVKEMDMAAANSEPSTLLEPKIDKNAYGVGLSYKEVIPLSLLGLVTFYGTGHQSVISSIQWKSAFLLTSTVTYPFSPLTVLTNSFGPLFLIGLAAPLLGLWNRVPQASVKEGKEEKVKIDVKVQGEAVLASLGVMLYYATLLLGTATSAAILRRHLMVWKVFAPRFMAGVLGLLMVDVGALVGVGLGVQRIGGKVHEVLKGAF